MEIFLNYIDIAVKLFGFFSIISAFIFSISKSARKAVKAFFNKQTKEIQTINKEQDEKINNLSEQIEQLTQLIYSINSKLELLQQSSEQQCRNTIKNIYYSYNKKKIIPLYERKTVDYIYNLYVNGFHGNSYATLMYKEIEKWDIDSSNQEEFESDF